MRNITRAIYRRQEEKRALQDFHFIESIAGIFHLQMNVLKPFLDATWGEPGERVYFACFWKALSRVGGRKRYDTKDFHACDDLFRTIVMAFAIALCMNRFSCKNLS